MTYPTLNVLLPAPIAMLEQHVQDAAQTKGWFNYIRRVLPYCVDNQSWGVRCRSYALDCLKFFFSIEINSGVIWNCLPSSVLIIVLLMGETVRRPGMIGQKRDNKVLTLG